MKLWFPFADSGLLSYSGSGVETKEPGGGGGARFGARHLWEGCRHPPRADAFSSDCGDGPLMRRHWAVFVEDLACEPFDPAASVEKVAIFLVTHAARVQLLKEADTGD